MFTNKLKTACLTSVIYLLCFQVFLLSGYYGWLYAGNVLFCISVVAYIFLKQQSNARLSLPVLTGKGISFSFVASFLCLAGGALLCLLNFYLVDGQKAEYVNLAKGNISLYGVKNLFEFLALTVTNSFPVNLVCGSLASFFTIGIMNEKYHFSSSKSLPSVKV